MNSVFNHCDKIFLRKLIKPNTIALRSTFQFSFSKWKNSNWKHFLSTSCRLIALKSERNNPNILRFNPIYSFVAAISLVKIYEILGINENKEVKKLMHKAKQHLEDGEVEEASSVYNEALKIAVNTQDHDDVYSIKEQLAVIAFFSKKYEDAEKFLEEVREYYIKKGLPIDDLKMAYVNLKLAETYESLNNFKKAEESYKLCKKGLKTKIKDALENKDDEVIELWIMSLTSKGHYLLKQGNFEKAYKYFKKAHEASVLIQGELSEQTVTLLQQLGAICFQKGDLESAVEHLKKATELGKHLPGMVELSNVYVTLGNIYLRQGFYKDAEVLCNQGYKNAVRHKYEDGIKESNACLEELKRVTSLS